MQILGPRACARSLVGEPSSGNNAPMHHALTVLLFAVAGMLVVNAAVTWAKLAQGKNDPNKPPIPVRLFRLAAGYTATAFLMLGIALAWFALVTASEIGG